MYYQNYEDYMRQVLGYPANNPNIYETYNYRNNQAYEDTYLSRNQAMSNMSEEEIRACYPEIYHLVYPMVCKVCDTNTSPITKELIEQMTDEVYLAIEDNSTVVNVRVDTPKPQENRSSSNSTRSSTTMPKVEKVASREDKRISRTDSNRNSRLEDTRTPKPREDRTARPTSNIPVESRKSPAMESIETVAQTTTTRQINSNLRDLIKILILFRLFGNRPINQRPPRTPFPGEPVRTPMGPTGRPPMQPMDYQNYLGF